ncbi:MAG: MFS transporter [Actinomycetota bacterium]|nr:MFS transporter [Actinomycetota bacterium]
MDRPRTYRPLRDLILFQGSGAAGDALVALALAGTLFFSVPEATARGRVALYLALTVAPFAIIAPLLSRVLDLHRAALRWALLIAALGRGALAWTMATRLDSLYLFPLAFGILLLSRAATVVRGAVLPYLVPEEESLVAANASLTRFAAVAGMITVGPGLLVVRFVGNATVLVLGAIVYTLGVLPAFRLPAPKGRRESVETLSARALARSVEVRQATVASAGMRFLVGFLVFHLAFSLRREDVGSIGLGLLIAAAAVGGLVAAVIAPALRRRMREEPIIVASLVVAGAAGVAVGRWFSLYAAAALVFFIGVTSGAAKLAFDAIVQRVTPEGGRGWAFARFESILQLTWVAGALIPLLLPIPGGPGVAGAGLTAAVLAGVYGLGRATVRRREKRTASPEQEQQPPEGVPRRPHRRLIR